MSMFGKPAAADSSKKNRPRPYTKITKKKNHGIRRICAPRALACALIVGCGISGAAAAAPPLTITVLAQESIAPKWVMEDGTAQGLCPDLMAAIERIEPRVRFAGYQQARSLLVIEDALETGRAGAAAAWRCGSRCRCTK